MSSLDLFFAKQGKESEKRKYEERKSQVTTVKGKISDASDGNVTNINGKIDGAVTKLASAINGISIDSLVGEMNGKKEKSGTNDSHLSSYEGYLSSEITDCETKIGNLETEISSLASRYEQALNEEKEAAKKMLAAITI